MIPVRVSFAVDFEFDRTSITRKAALWALAAQIATFRPGLSKIDIASALYARERLGTTAIGGGVALPHTVLSGLEESMIVVRRLETPVEFEAADGLAVDTLVALMGGRHDIKWLRAALLRLNRLSQDASLAQRLLEATTRSEAVAAIIALGLDTHGAQTGGAHSAKTGVVRSPQGPLSRIHGLQ
ncbi:PTS sugar transporter subunit IIA [uncultured Nitratireductor sp.]|uniref:PTS sugar transporter subunit IIA n=1 Tax=uncultured Nitratireductor sp. TaxID=520953 RepID=UPI0025CFD400|nr:PTS sugar transporter subunit IIA [uncultured Nitratireductor sp.]